MDAHQGSEVYGNSLGFFGRTRKTRQEYQLFCHRPENGSMQRDYWYSSARRFDDLDAPETVGEKTASRTLRRLGARRVPTCRVPVLYEAPVASSLLGHFISAISGGALYRRASFLLDHLNQKIFPDFVRIHEQPLLVGAMGSAAFDSEGVATASRDIVSSGVFKVTFSAPTVHDALGNKTTGNAGGVHNLTIDHGTKSLEEMIKDLKTGFLVTELIGFGINSVTGDYSRGAAGLWIENGEIAYPVEEVTVAGNLKDIFQNIVAVGNDVDTRKSTRCGSILVEGLTIAGE